MSASNMASCSCQRSAIGGGAGMSPFAPGALMGPAVSASAMAHPRVTSDPSVTASLAQTAPFHAGGFAPAVMVHAFEPAFYTPRQAWAMLPYAPSTVSVTTPAFSAAGTGGVPNAGVALAATTAGTQQTALPAGMPCANACGCGGQAFVNVQPTAYAAWKGMFDNVNRPYQQACNMGLF